MFVLCSAVCACKVDVQKGAGTFTFSRLVATFSRHSAILQSFNKSCMQCPRATGDDWACVGGSWCELFLFEVFCGLVAGTVMVGVIESGIASETVHLEIVQ